MKYYIEKLQHRVDLYKNKYKQKPRKMAFKLFWWNFKCLFKTFPKPKQINQPKINEACISWFKVLEWDNTDITYKYKKELAEFKIPQLKGNSHIYFNIAKALELNPKIKRLGLVFFMGIGDYFYATNFIEILKKEYPNLILDAYVSKNFDGNNSPLVGKCLETNPNIDKVYYYDGHQNIEYWKNYDYSECYNLKSDDTLILPMVYEHNEYVSSRTETLCKTFNLPEPLINPLPIIYDYEDSEEIKSLFNQYRDKMDKVVFIQMSARSSNFTYPFVDEIIEQLLDDGFFVISVEKTNIVNSKLLVIDIKKYTINDSISLVRMIKNYHIPICFLTTISCFASISSALQIPNLCMQHTYDPCISSVYYSNIYLVVNKKYNQIPADRTFICPQYKIKEVENSNNLIYSYDFIVTAFHKFMNITSII
mgnify:FL=1